MFISLSIQMQRLTLWQDKTRSRKHQTWLISSAKNGVGQIEGSECTPLGLHCIREKIGHALPLNAVMVGRVPTGEIYSSQLHQAQPNRDWILTRILRLEGKEQGINQGRDAQGRCCDSWLRYIYIHGTPDQTQLGVTGSKGCIRMHNQDLIELFDLRHL